MLRFQHQEYLWWLLLAPILVLLFMVAWRWAQQKYFSLGDRRLLHYQLLGYIPGRNTTKFLLPVLALVCAIIGYANLRRSAGVELAKRKGVDVMVALDISRSMLATDITPDRLTRSKMLIDALLKKLKGDRVGLIVFAGRAYLQVPLTVDYSAIKLSLQSVNTESAPSQGTVIGQAIELADHSFSQKENKYKALVLISDGEDHDATAVTNAEAAYNNGALIYTVGVGAPQGVEIFNPETKQPILDAEGHVVVSKLNEAELKAIATAGHADYTLLNNPELAARHLAAAINDMEQKNLGASVYTDYQSYYQYFIAAAVLLLIIDVFIKGARLVNEKSVA